MSREWKPGDVAAVRWNFGVERSPGIAVRVPGGWCCHRDGGSHHHSDQADVTVHPLVVIDPEDRQQVERLAAALTAQSVTAGGCKVDDYPYPVNWRLVLADNTQAALRSLIDPEKPPEPTGLGAVVEDEDGNRWVRWTGNDSAPWTAADTGGEDQTWDEITAVKVLSEGVSP